MSDQVDEPAIAQLSRTGLLVATSTYADSRLRPLIAPEPEVIALAEVLSDPKVGAFNVQTVVNQPAHLVMRAIERHLTCRRRDDFVLLHLSGHGVKDADGQLYFAAADTDRDLLASTTVPGSFLRDQLNRSRARTIVVLLDCCYSGAFVSGIRGDPDLHLGEQLLQRTPGRGRVIIAASGAVQYAWEGNDQAGAGQPGGFTAALIRGLRTGEADRDQDGRISIQELFDYLFERVREVRTDQQPEKYEYGVQGTIWVAQAIQHRRPPSLESEIVLVIDDDRDIVRFLEVNLQLEGFEVIVAYDGEDGLAKALELQPGLIVLGVVMPPGMDGFEVCMRLRKDDRGRHIPVIFLTGRSSSADILRGFDVGADDYVTKPFIPMELITRIKTRLQRGREFRSLAT